MKNINKINTISLILLIFNLIACQQPAYISGKIEGREMQGTRVYLIEPESLRSVAGSYLGKVIDSALIKSDGSFEFHNQPESNDAVLLELAIQQNGMAPNNLETDDPMKSNYMPILWQAGEPIRISARADQFQKTFSMEHPSDINKALLELRDINQEAYQTFLAGKHWDIEEGTQLLEQEHAILQYQNHLIEFANSTQYLLPAMVALRWVSPNNIYERVPEFLVDQCNKWKKENADHPWVIQLCEESDPAKLPVLVGSVFPNLNFPMLTKDTLSFQELMGKNLTIIDLWASWCGPCRVENREILMPLWDEYHGQGLQIVAIGLESDELSWKAAVEFDGTGDWFQSSHLQGDDEPLYRQMRVRTIPANFIVDDKGVVIAKNVHGSGLSDFVKSYMEINNEKKRN